MSELETSVILSEWLTVSDGKLFNLNCINFWPYLEVTLGKGFLSFPFEFSRRQHVKCNTSVWDKWILKMLLQTVSDISCICHLERRALVTKKLNTETWLHAKCVKIKFVLFLRSKLTRGWMIYFLVIFLWGWEVALDNWKRVRELITIFLQENDCNFCVLK